MYRPPDWHPLERALTATFGRDAVNATAAFWFIGFVPGPDDVGELRLYEHTRTHRRVALDREGQAYRWFADFEGYGRSAGEQPLVEILSE